VSEDICQTVMVDGEPILVRVTSLLTPEEVEAFAWAVKAAKRLNGIRACPDCEQGKHANCTGEAWDNDTDAPTACPCSLNRAGPHHLGAKP
jgi:RecJ-like exonuclease